MEIKHKKDIYVMEISFYYLKKKQKKKIWTIIKKKKKAFFHLKSTVAS